MNTDKHPPLCVPASPRLPVLLAVLGLMIALTVSFPAPAAGVVYVNWDAIGANNGSSWADAYRNIQAGIDDAVADGGDEVWVAQGTYYEAIVMKSGVALYGGFNGTENSRLGRDWQTNITTIDGSKARGGLLRQPQFANQQLVTSNLSSY